MITGLLSFILWVACTIIFIIGMIKPTLAILPYAKKGRKEVFKVWFMAGLIFFIVFSVSLLSDTDENISTSQESDSIVLESKDELIKETPTPTPEPKQTPIETPPPTALEFYQSLTFDSANANLDKRAGRKNLSSSIDLFCTYSADEITTIESQQVSLDEIEKASWKYTGKMIDFEFKISDITSYAPNSNNANNLADGNVCSEMHGYDYDSGDGHSILFVNGSSCDNYDEGDTINVTAILVGYFEGKNAFGGIVQNMVFYTVYEFIN